MDLPSHLPALVAAQLRVRPNHRTCYYCDAALALDADDVCVAPWGELFVRPGVVLPTSDHKIPRSRGGTNDLDNLVLACRSCNSSKRDKAIGEYLDGRQPADMLDAIYGSAARFDRAVALAL